MVSLFSHVRKLFVATVACALVAGLVVRPHATGHTSASGWHPAHAARPLRAAPADGTHATEGKRTGAPVRRPGAEPTISLERRTLPPVDTAPSKRPAVDDDTLVVHRATGVSDTDADRRYRAAGAERLSSIEALNVDVIRTSDRKAAEAELDDAPEIDEVEPNRIRYAAAEPNDPAYFDQAHLFLSRFPVAWEISKGSTALDIAVIDTGVDVDHPDLDSRIAGGYDFVNGDGNAMDDNGHGTMVAGLAAAETDNGIGVAGAAWNARIIPVKVLDADGGGFDFEVAQGIVYAADRGAEVINLSLGGPGSSDILDDAVAYAVSRNVVVVAAAGNEATDVPSYPAAIPSVVAVGSTDFDRNTSVFTNHGPWVDLVAPGEEMVSTALTPGAGEEYAIGDGTSFAAPVVSGAALLHKARTPSATAGQIAARLASSAADRGPRGIDRFFGRGLLDAYAAAGGRTAASPPLANAGANEPNHVPADATSIGENTTDLITPVGDVDWFRADVAEPGAVTFEVNGSTVDGGRFDPLLEVFNADLDRIGLAQNTELDGTKLVTFGAEAPGRFYLRVRNRMPVATYAAYSVSVAAPNVLEPTVVQAPPVAVRASTPADNAVVSAATQPMLDFRTTIDLTNASLGSISLRKASGEVVAANEVVDSVLRRVTLTPSLPLTAGETYVIGVDGLEDTSGVPTEAFESRFTIERPQAKPPAEADINGDGYDDVIVGAPTEDIGSRKDAGAFHVLLGSPSGAKTIGSKLYTQDTKDLPGTAEAGDRFGGAIATGDVNGDGYDDVAVGAAGEDIGSRVDSGLVHLFLGSATGLRILGSQTWTQDSKNVPGAAEKSDRFGAAVVFGAFDGIAGDDLAIGAPGEAVDIVTTSGVVYMLSGRSTGLTGTGAKSWTTASANGWYGSGTFFGAGLAAGDFDGDTHDDLVVGAPGADRAATDAGTITLFNGTIVGLRPSGEISSEMFTGQAPTVGERFGSALAAGDFGGLAQLDAYDDLAVGAPGAASGEGRVDVVFSDWMGLGLTVNALRQSGNGNQPEAGDQFGAALAAGRTAAGAPAWLAVGAPGEDEAGLTDVGVVHVTTLGAAVDSTPLAPAPISQNSAPVQDVAETADRFGTSVRVLDADRDGFPDVVAGTPNERVGTKGAAGTVHVLRHTDHPATITSQQLIQGANGIPGAVESGDRLGASVGA